MTFFFFLSLKKHETITLLDKQRFKAMYLDAVGEALDSPRRSSVRGMWGSHVLQAPGGGAKVEVPMTKQCCST